jgi:high-affinity Fe2+/Pb2+ permease
LGEGFRVRAIPHNYPSISIIFSATSRISLPIIAAGLLNLSEWWLDNELPCSAEAMAAIYSEFVINASMNAVAHTKI